MTNDTILSSLSENELDNLRKSLKNFDIAIEQLSLKHGISEQDMLQGLRDPLTGQDVMSELAKDLEGFTGNEE